MDAKTIERLLFSSALLLLAALMPLLAPPDAYAGVKNSDIPDELRIYREAMVWFKKAEALIGTPKENSEEHAALFRKVIEIDPSFLEAHYNLGLIYANQKKIEKAAASFETVLALDHRFNGAIHFMLASLYQETGDDASAISALEKGLLRNPRDVKYLRALAFLQLRGNEDEA
ncbi:MAG TPA: tetratricopeptide repeat protein, partial [Acidobacteriota bacterium]|nr:tetratricopeptide repeat protein [Acidobacteriota bacterium]